MADNVSHPRRLDPTMELIDQPLDAKVDQPQKLSKKLTDPKKLVQKMTDRKTLVQVFQVKVAGSSPREVKIN